MLRPVLSLSKLFVLLLSIAAFCAQAEEESCFRVGSFGLTEAELWRDELRTAGVTAWLSDERYQDWQGTWIVIPTENIEDRLKLVKRLNEIGVRDWQVLTKADHAGWVSVGIFDSPEGVKVRLKQLEPLDREVMLEPRFRGQGRYDVEFKVTATLREQIPSLAKAEPMDCAEAKP